MRLPNMDFGCNSSYTQLSTTLIVQNGSNSISPFTKVQMGRRRGRGGGAIAPHLFESWEPRPFTGHSMFTTSGMGLKQLRMHPRMRLKTTIFSKFSGGACPRTPLGRRWYHPPTVSPPPPPPHCSTPSYPSEVGTPMVDIHLYGSSCYTFHTPRQSIMTYRFQPVSAAG